MFPIATFPQRHILRLSRLDVFSDGGEDNQGMIQPLFLVAGPTSAASDQHKARGEGLQLFSGKAELGTRAVCVTGYSISVSNVHSANLLLALTIPHQRHSVTVSIYINTTRNW